MAIFRGVGGSGDSSDNSFLQEVTAQANAAEQSKLGAQNALNFAISSASAASASASSILNLTAATGAAGTDASYDASTGILTIPRGDTGADAVVDTSSVSAAGAVMDSDFTTSGFMKRTSYGAYEVDTNTYLTSHQDISGKADLTGANFTGAITVTNGDVGIGTLLANQNINVFGNITVSGTVDGRDVATDGSKLDGIEALADVTDTANVTAAGALMDSEVTNLAQVKAFDSSDYATSTQGTTADNALPKAGGQMTGNITFSGTQTVDGRDVSVDGAKLDTLERVYRRRFLKHAYNSSTTIATLTSSYSSISPTIRGTSTTGSENELDLHITAIHYDINTANEFIFYVNLVAPYAPAEDTVNLGTVSDVSGTTTSIRTFAVSGDITKHLSPYCGMSTTSTGANAFGLDNNHSWYYDSVSNKTIMTTYNYQTNLPSNGDTLYLHPFDWESSGTQLTGDFYPADAYNASGNVNIRRDHKLYLGYHKTAPQLSVYAKETTSSENIAITAVGGVLTQYQD